jgi:hypothetical protein
MQDRLIQIRRLLKLAPMVEEVGSSLSHPPADRVVEEVAGEHDHHRLVAATTAPDVVDNPNTGEVVIGPSAVGGVDNGDVNGVPLGVPLECIIVHEGTGYLELRAVSEKFGESSPTDVIIINDYDSFAHDNSSNRLSTSSRRRATSALMRSSS